MTVMPRSGGGLQKNNVSGRTFVLGSLLYGILAILGLVVFFPALYVYSRVPSDFLQDYGAAQSIQENRSIYDLKILGIEGQSNSIINAHPPFMAILFIPLTFLPPGDAFWVWGIFFSLTLLGESLVCFAHFANSCGDPAWFCDSGILALLVSFHCSHCIRTGIFAVSGKCFGGVVVPTS